MAGSAPRRIIFLWMVLVIVAGVALRKLPLGLPFFVTKWGGTWLWGAMIWCGVTLLSRQRHPARTSLIATAIAFATEFLKLIHTPALDRIRATSAGGFLLGHHFATADLAVYALAIVTMAALNGRQRQIAGSSGVV